MNQKKPKITRKWIPINMDTVSEPLEERSAKNTEPPEDSDEEQILLV